MSATTVKLDGPILKDLKGIKSADQTLTSLIRDLLGAEIHRRKMAQAAETYMTFLTQNPGEVEELDVWASVNLEQEIAPQGKKRS